MSRVTNRCAHYHAALESLPPSGSGLLHRRLLGVANLARNAGLEPELAEDGLAAHVHGPRRVSPREIQDAVAKAYRMPRARVRVSTPPTIDGDRLLGAILERGDGHEDADLAELSTVRIDWPVERDGVEVLNHLYFPDDKLFLGSRYAAGDEHTAEVGEWLRRLERGDSVPEHIIPNPLTGLPGKAKDQRTSYRADACVSAFRFAVVEFDNMPRARQIEFWAGVMLPVVALIDSGGKSIHAWVRIDAAGATEWERRVEDKLFGLLGALGADRACRNEARLSRMPGHLRRDTGRQQRLLYLNPDGGPLIP